MLNSPLQPRLEGRVALVTGASRGIGLAIAERLISEGAQVCITARNAETLSAVAATLPSESVIAVAGKADDPQHQGDALAAIADTFGRLDIVVNNAGINPVYGSLDTLDLGSARKLLEVNLLASLAWIQAALAIPNLGFGSRPGASVVNLSSVTGQVVSPGIGWYGISKAAIDQLTRTLAVELAPRIRVNAVAPAVVKTVFSLALYEGKETEVAAEYPLGRLGLPEDIAAAVAFLVSDDASWITGQILNLDGGLLVAGGVA